MVSTNYIDKEYTNIIKGIALIFMFIHHFFTFPDRLVSGINYAHIDMFSEFFHTPFKLCVSIFAFLTGYFYYYNNKKNLRYSFRKATDLYVNYIIILLMMLALDGVLKCYDFNIKNIALELLVIHKPNMEFCWYVFFFFMAIFILPFFSRIANKSSVLAFSLGVVVPNIIVFIINAINKNIEIGKIDLVFDMVKYISWFPCVASGYVFAKEGLFQRLDISYSKNKLIKIIVYLSFMVLPFFARNVSSSFDFLYAPLFIFGLIKVLKFIPNLKVLLPISVIGKYSLCMWFIHSVFFNVSKEYTQPILFYPKNPVLVLIWGSLLCLAISYVLSFPINFLNRTKNKLFKL